MLSKRWEIAPENPRVEEKLAAALQIRPLAARLLVNRGITSIEAAREFLTPSLQRLHDPFLMRGMAEAVQPSDPQYTEPGVHRHLRRLRCGWDHCDCGAVLVLP